MKNYLRLILLSVMALASPAFGQTYVGPVQTLPPGCNSTNFLRGDNTCASPAGSGGTVTSVGLSTPSWLTVAGSPVNSSGTLAVSATSGQTANSFLATPSGSAGAVSLRTITLTDLPATIAANTTGNAATATALAVNPTDCSANQYASAIDASGNLTCAQVAATQVTGLATSATTDTTNATNITNGSLAATQGGTGQTTITLGDFLYGSASNVLSKLAGNISAAKEFLTQTGNGTVSAAPVWSAIAAADIQTLTPVWTGNQEISDTEPRYILTDTSRGTDLKKWDLDLNTGVLCFRTRTDADGAGQNALCATRGTTTALTNLTLGYSTSGTYTFPFTGSATFSGSILGQATVFSNVLVNGSVPGGAGIYRPSSGVLGFACSTGVACGQIDGNKLLTLQSGIVSGGTKFTAAGTGCTVGTTTGGATAGTFTLAAGPCTSVAITMNGATGATATSGWTCQAHDRTAPTVLIGGESSSTTTTATITIPTGAGATDVISFSCTGF